MTVATAHPHALWEDQQMKSVSHMNRRALTHLKLYRLSNGKDSVL